MHRPSLLVAGQTPMAWGRGGNEPWIVIGIMIVPADYTGGKSS